MEIIGIEKWICKQLLNEIVTCDQKLPHLRVCICVHLVEFFFKHFIARLLQMQMNSGWGLITETNARNSNEPQSIIPVFIVIAFAHCRHPRYPYL